MTDIEHAKQLLTDARYTCVICRGDDIHTSEKRGVAPLIELLDSKIDVRGYSAADKAVGKAAAMLFVLLGVSEIYAAIMSRSAKKILDEYATKTIRKKSKNVKITSSSMRFVSMAKSAKAADA